jgi:hypothetical protein
MHCGGKTPTSLVPTDIALAAGYTDFGCIEVSLKPGSCPVYRLSTEQFACVGDAFCPTPAVHPATPLAPMHVKRHVPILHGAAGRQQAPRQLQKLPSAAAAAPPCLLSQTPQLPSATTSSSLWHRPALLLLTHE